MGSTATGALVLDAKDELCQATRTAWAEGNRRNPQDLLFVVGRGGTRVFHVGRKTPSRRPILLKVGKRDVFLHFTNDGKREGTY